MRLKDDLSALANEVKVVKHGAKTQAWQIDAISGATVTSRAVGKGINDAAQLLLPRLVPQAGSIEGETMSGPSPAAFSMAPPSRWEEFTEGMWRRNPVFVMVLGMCPTLAVTVSAVNSISMGLATTFVLAASCFLVSAAAPPDPEGGAHRHLYRDHRHLRHRGGLCGAGHQPRPLRGAGRLYPADRGELPGAGPRRGARGAGRADCRRR